MIKTPSRAQIEHIHEILYRPNTEGLDDGIEWTKFPGLFVQSARNSRSWIFRWNVPGKKRVMSLGTREAVTIQEAVDLAARYMEIVRAGGDPRAERDRLREEAGSPSAAPLSPPPPPRPSAR
jgi:hypothetical protein